MAIDIAFYNEAYFTFDKPAPYKLKCGVELSIAPVALADSMLFMTSYGVLDIDKNSDPNPEVISMSYLKYLIKCVIPNSEMAKFQFVNLCILCLGMEYPEIKYDEMDRPMLCELNKVTKEVLYSITAKEFDDIKRIILYQNLPNYDDEYINPELRESMNEMDALKNKSITPPSLERRMAIITAHSGIGKKEQLEMTFRSHSLLFQEVTEEVEYMVTKPLAIYGGKSNEVQWIFKKKKGKFDDYITSVEKYNKSMGGDGVVHSTTSISEALASQFEQF